MEAAVGRGLSGGQERAQEVVPILGTDSAEAASAGMLEKQVQGGLVASGIGVVTAQQRDVLEGVEPAGQTASGAGCGSDEAVGEQNGGGRGGPGRQPEAPRLRREPGARDLKVEPSGSVLVPTSLAPAEWPE